MVGQYGATTQLQTPEYNSTATLMSQNNYLGIQNPMGMVAMGQQAANIGIMAAMGQQSTLMTPMMTPMGQQAAFMPNINSSAAMMTTGPNSAAMMLPGNLMTPNAGGPIPSLMPSYHPDNVNNTMWAGRPPSMNDNRRMARTAGRDFRSSRQDHDIETSGGGCVVLASNLNEQVRRSFYGTPRTPDII